MKFANCVTHSTTTTMCRAYRCGKLKNLNFHILISVDRCEIDSQLHMLLRSNDVKSFLHSIKIEHARVCFEKKTLAFIFLLLFVCQRATQSKDVDIKAKICVVCFFGHANIAVEISSEIVHIHTIYPPCYSLSLSWFTVTARVLSTLKSKI